MRTLIIGGTGTVGREAIAQLAGAGAHFRVMARRPESAGFPPGVEALYGDLTLPETLDQCLDGVDTVFLVWTAPPPAVAAALDRINALVLGWSGRVGRERLGRPP